MGGDLVPYSSRPLSSSSGGGLLLASKSSRQGLPILAAITEEAHFGTDSRLLRLFSIMSDTAESQSVVLLVEGESLSADRARLCAASPYFAAMFTADFVERGKKEVELSCVTAAAVRELLRRASCQAGSGSTGGSSKFGGSTSSIARRKKTARDEGGNGSRCSQYSSASHLEEEGFAFELLQAAGMLQFESAREDCADRLVASLRPELALETLSKAELLAERRLAAAAARVALWHFNEASKADFLPQVSFEIMGRLLCDVRLNVSDEVRVLSVIGRWWMGGEEGGSGRLPRNLDALLGCVRFSRVPESELQSLVEKWRGADSAGNKLLVERVKKCYEGTVPSSELEPRRPPVVPAVLATKRHGGYEIFTLDCEKSVLESSEVVLCEGLMGRWSELEGFRMLQVTGGSRLYLTGGEFGLGRGDWNMMVASYDALTDRWSEVARLERPRRHHGATASADGTKLAVFGGFGRMRDFQASCDMVHLDTGLVEQLPDLPEGCKSPACCFFRGNLYVVKKGVYRLDKLDKKEISGGGQEEEEKMLEGEGLKHKWTDVGVEVAPQLDFVLAVAAGDDCVYLASKHDYKLYRLDFEPGEARLNEVEGGQFHSETQNLCVVDGDVFNFSSDQFGTTSCVEAYSPASGSFEILWEGETESAPTPFDFSPYYSLGCFPFVQY